MIKIVLNYITEVLINITKLCLKLMNMHNLRTVAL